MNIIDQEYFEKLAQYAMGLLNKKDEHLSLSLAAEDSQFVRINSAQIRQTGTVHDSHLDLAMVYEPEPSKLYKAGYSLTLNGLSDVDQNAIKYAVTTLQREVREIPEDPYAQVPLPGESSTIKKKGELLSRDEAVLQILTPLLGPGQSTESRTDLAGIFASGPIVRAIATSSGQRHWFYTERFNLDYSLYTPAQKALKGTFSGSHWKSDEYQSEIQSARRQLTALEKKPVSIPRGTHRTYLAPAAVADLVSMLSWGAMSEASIRQGESPLRKLRTGEKEFSPRFSLFEDFSGNESPRFNSEGELSSETLPLIERGRLTQALVSSRTAKEYDVPSNFATASEGLRAPRVAPGGLSNDKILTELGTGLYLSNLHYLNWSDQVGGRITGMTRYACFWVENGEIVAPIESMRFDETVFNFFGTALVDLTQSLTFVPEVGSYGMRQLGGTWCPGILLSGMNFTL